MKLMKTIFVLLAFSIALAGNSLADLTPENWT